MTCQHLNVLKAYSTEGEKNTFSSWTILRSQVEETRSTRTRVWKMYYHRSMIQMWPVPLSFGHIPLRSFLTTAPSHSELLPQFPCLYKGHLHFPNCSCQKCEVLPETFSLSSSSKSIKRSRSAVLQNAAPVTSYSPPPHSSSKRSHLGSGLPQSPSTWVSPSLPFLSSHSFFNGRSLSSKIAPHQPNSTSKETALASSATMPTLQRAGGTSTALLLTHAGLQVLQMH